MTLRSNEVSEPRRAVTSGDDGRDKSDLTPRRSATDAPEGQRPYPILWGQDVKSYLLHLVRSAQVSQSQKLDPRILRIERKHS